MVLVDGQMVGDMRRTVRAGEVLFEIGLFCDLDDDELDALYAAADCYGEFLGLDPRIVTSPYLA